MNSTNRLNDNNKENVKNNDNNKGDKKIITNEEMNKDKKGCIIFWYLFFSFVQNNFIKKVCIFERYLEDICIMNSSKLKCNRKYAKMNSINFEY